jgi:methyl-accepting chemotaxis protein
MALGVDEATRIVRFCMAGDGWGTATTEDDARVLKLVVDGAVEAQVYRFEAASFEEALKLAVDAGVLRAGSVEKQIAFLGRTSSREPGARRETTHESSTGPVPFPETTSIVSALVHETQRERGISSLYAASGGRLFGDELVAQWRTTERRCRDLLAFQSRYADRLPSAVAGQLHRAQDLLDNVVASRARIEKLKMLPTELIESYTRMNRELLRVVDSLLVTVADPLQRPTALAWIALLYAKEKTGIERAQLVSAFERDRFFDGQYQSLLGLIAARESYLHLFAAAAPPPAGDLMHEKMESDAANTVQQMERIALAHRQGGFGVDPTDWFTAISLQMDLLGDVESAVRTSLAPA